MQKTMNIGGENYPKGLHLLRGPTDSLLHFYYVNQKKQNTVLCGSIVIFAGW